MVTADGGGPGEGGCLRFGEDGPERSARWVGVVEWRRSTRKGDGGLAFCSPTCGGLGVEAHNFALFVLLYSEQNIVFVSFPGIYSVIFSGG